VPVKSSNTVLTFSGNEKATANNNLGDWALDIGQLNFNSTTMGSILTGNAFGFLPLNGSQQINQNSPYGGQIENTFALRSGSDSQINLNASGPLHVAAVYLDASSGTARQLVIGGTNNDLNTFVVNGTIAKSGSGYDPDMVIQNNKRVAVFGALTFGSGTDGSVMINSGRLEFHGSGSMTGAPVIGSSSGSDSAMLLLNSDGQTMANQLEILGGSSGRRVIGGQNTSGNVTFSGTVIGNNSPASYDVVAAPGGSVTLSGTRNLNSVLNINRPEEGGFYGGTVVLSGTSTSTAGVNVYGGILSVGADNHLGSSGTLTLDGGTLKQSAVFSTARRIVIGANGGKIDTSAVVPSVSVPITFSGGISGTGNLTIASGMLNIRQGVHLTGDNTYIGSTTITSGYVNGSSATAFGNAANTVVLNGGGLYFNANRTNNYKLSLVGAFSVIEVESGTTVNNTGVISGSGGLEKHGTGTLVLTTENPYTGATNLYTGTLVLATPRALAGSVLRTSYGTTLSFAVEGNSTYHLGGLAGGQIVQIGGNSLSLGGSNQDWDSYIGLVGTGSLIKVGTGKMTIQGSGYFDIPTLQVDGGEFHLNGACTLRPSISVSVASGAILNNPGTIGSLSGLGTVKGNVTINSAGNSTFAGNFSKASLAKSGTGTLSLSGTGTGFVSVGGGTLELTAGASLDTETSYLRVGFSNGDDGSLLIKSGATVTSPAALIGYNAGGKGAITVEGTLFATADIWVGGSGVGSLTIKDGGLAVVGRDLLLSPNGLPSSGRVDIEAGGTLQIGTGGNGGTMSGVGVLTNHGTIVVNRAGNYTLDTDLNGTGELVKQGGGTLTVPNSGSHTYSGATTISAGTLVVNGSLAAASAVQVAAGATLSGTGTVAGGVAVSGTIAPGGNAIGTLSTGSVNLTGTWACDINGASCDVLAITGDFFTGATAQLVVTGTPTADRYVIATYTGSLGATASSESPVLPSGYELGVDFVNKQLLLVKSVVVAPPVLTALPGASSVTKNSATLGGEVTASEATVTGRGVVYALTATNADPEIGGTGVTQLGTSGTTGAFTVSATGLTAASAYSFKAYAISSAGTRYSEAGTFTTLAQAAPSFAGYAATVKEGKTLALSLAKILARATDPDGGAVTLTDVFGPSAQGGTVSLTGTLNYTPAASFTGTDSFDIELTGSQGGILRATVTVTVTANTAPASNQTEMRLRDGKVDLTFRGIPGRSYTVQRSTNLLTWTTLATVVAGADGRIAYTDPSPPQPSGYYRAQ
jgi:autotransporter-associated beta strand protein/T5SS/PEP-CTERM-associated repeat protein